MAEKLKKGWTRVAFGDVVQLCRERSIDPAADGFDRYVGLEHLEPGDLKIRRWGNVADGTTFTNIFHAGQVLFGKRRAYQRKVAVADFDGVCSGDIYVLKPKNENLLSELLPFICQTDGFFEHAIGTSAGSLSPRTNWESLASYEFTLPPLEEQRRIAKVLNATRILIEALRLTLCAIDMLDLSLGTNILSRNTGSRCRISEIARFRSGDGIAVSQLPKTRSMETSVPVLGGNGVAGYTNVPMNNIPIPTIVIGRVGEYCGAIHFIHEPAWVSDNALFMCELHKSVDPRYLSLCLTALRLNHLRSGGAQPLVNQQILGNLLIPLPSLAVQILFIKQHETITGCRDTTAQRMAHVQKLMVNAFKMMEG